MRRTGWDVALGVALVVASLVVVAHVVVATAVSLLVLGWAAVVGGVVLALGAFVRLGAGGFWATLVGGLALLAAGGLLLLDPRVGALTVTVFVGAAFLAGGVVRLVTTFGSRAAGSRWQHALAGAASLLVGGWILANPAAATLTVLGTLLAVELLVEGIALLVVGREHRTPGSPPGGPPPPAVAV